VTAAVDPDGAVRGALVLELELGAGGAIVAPITIVSSGSPFASRTRGSQRWKKEVYSEAFIARIESARQFGKSEEVTAVAA
jgi:hypothetical protein